MTQHREDILFAKITRLVRVGWLIAVGAFISGGWSTTLEFRDHNRQQKDLAHDSQIGKLEESTSLLVRRIDRVEATSVTAQDARDVADRVIKLESKLTSVVEDLDRAIQKLEQLADKQVSL